MEPVAADIVALIEQVSDGPAHLLGYSMGGRLALYVAVHHGQYLRSLTLESASPGLATAIEQTERRDRDNALATALSGKASSPLWTSGSGCRCGTASSSLARMFGGVCVSNGCEITRLG